MKKALSIVLVIVFCLSLAACADNGIRVEDEIQGTWVCTKEAQGQVQLKFQNGSVTRTDNTSGTSQTTSGTYSIDKDDNITVSYTDGSTQTFTTYINADFGITLMDNATGDFYSKTN